MGKNLIQTNTSKFYKIIKYILMSIIVAIAAKYIPDNLLQDKEIIIIGTTSAIVFAILDMVSPSIKIVALNDTKQKVIVEGTFKPN